VEEIVNEKSKIRKFCGDRGIEPILNYSLE
jgi:hypothetical protein